MMWTATHTLQTERSPVSLSSASFEVLKAIAAVGLWKQYIGWSVPTQSGKFVIRTRTVEGRRRRWYIGSSQY